MPCVIKPPANTLHASLPPGCFNRSFSTIMDFAPTFLEMAGVSLPPAVEKMVPARLGELGAASVLRKVTTFRGVKVHAIRGKSWLPLLLRGQRGQDDETWAIHSSQEPIGWELFARGALRKGPWKIVHINKAQGGAGVGDQGWELFNVVDDPGETRDLAASEPEKLKELVAHWDEYVVECGVVWGETAQAPGLSRVEAPDLWQDEIELQMVWMGASAGDCPGPCQ